jgi:transposase
MDEIVSQHSGREIHVILDNLNSQKPKRDRWLAHHPNVHLHYAPTRASWLNQVECWFSNLSRRALRGPASHRCASCVKRLIALSRPIIPRLILLNGPKRSCTLNPSDVTTVTYDC